MYDVFMKNELKHKLYQMFILGTGKNLKSAVENGLGGVIFFTKDIHSKAQFKSLIKSLPQNLFFSIDQEGGRVERTENIYGGKKYLSAKFAFEQGILEAQTHKMLTELKDYGINLNFAPCLDVNTNPNNPIIGERAYSSNPDEVIKAYNIIEPIYQEYGIIHCVKHFPGHGDASADSHIELPQIDLTLDEMESSHIKPFRHAINAPMLMVAHLKFSCFGELPTSLNKNAIDYLKNQLGYKGIIITDDMMMGAVQNLRCHSELVSESQKLSNINIFPYEIAIRAGVDMFIFRNSDDEIIEMIENLYQKASIDAELQKNIEASYKKIKKLKLYVTNT